MKRDLRVLTIACLLSVGAAALILGARRGPYRRYISPPLPDGARYTFLYPPSVVGITTTDGEVSMRANWTEKNPLVNALKRTYYGLRRAPNTYNLLEVTLGTLPSAPTASTRSKSTFHGHDSNFTELTDQRNGRILTLQYHCQVGRDADSFAREDAIVSRSFQLLPPGTSEKTLQVEATQEKPQSS